MRSIDTRFRHVLRALWDGGRGWILVFVALGWFLTLGTRFVFPALFPHLRDAFALDLATLGALYTLLWATYGIGQFPAGIVGDRIGDRRSLILSTALSAGAVVVVMVAIGPWGLAVGMILFGVTSALYGPARFTVLNRVYPDYDGTAMGISESFGQIGNAALPALAGVLATMFVWQAGFLYLVPLFAIVAVGLWLVPSDYDEQTATGGDATTSRSIRELVASVCFPLSLLLAVVLALVMFIIQGATGFYPTYLVDVKGFPLGTASILFGLLFASGALIQPIAGAISDTFGARRTLFVMLGTLVVGLLLVPVATTVVHFIFVTVLLGSAPGTIPVIFSRMTSALPADVRGTGLGLLRTGSFLVASTGSFVVGNMADVGLFDEAFVLLAILAVAAFVVTIVLGRTNA